MKKTLSVLLVSVMTVTLFSGIFVSAAEAPTQVPLIAGPGGKPVAILKADDLHLKTMDAFRGVYDVITKLGAVGSFGAITNGCESFTDAEWAEVKSWVDNGFEIWHHGYKHDGVYVDNVFQNDADFIGRSSEEMEFYLNYGIDLFAEHGIKIQSVGVPYNKSDATFVGTLNRRFASVITSVMNSASNLESAYCLGNRLDAEDGTKTALQAVQEAYAKNPDAPYYVMQMHASVQVKDIAALEEAIVYLKDEIGCVFMTPSQYIEYIEAAANEGKPEITGITLEDATFAYDATQKSIAINGTLPEGATLAYANEANTNAGTHHVRALIKKAGYQELVLLADVTITPADVTVTADDATKEAGAADPALTYEVTSGTIYANDTFTGAITREAGEVAGTYAINQGTLSLGKNYNLTFVPGTFTIEATQMESEGLQSPTFTKDGNTVTFNANLISNAPTTGVFVLTLYDNTGKIVGTALKSAASTANAITISGSITTTKPAVTYKAFMLADFFSMKIGSAVLSGNL